MTARELQGILDRWVERMGLERWEITLDLENPPEAPDDATEYPYAQIIYSGNYETAKIRLHKDRCKDRTDAERSIVHELVHLWTRDMEESLVTIYGELHPSANRAFREAFNQRHEAAVELIARRLIAIAGSA